MKSLTRRFNDSKMHPISENMNLKIKWNQKQQTNINQLKYQTHFKLKKTIASINWIICADTPIQHSHLLSKYDENTLYRKKQAICKV